MSFSVDANLFLYAANVRDPHHVRAYRFLERIYRASDIVIVTYPAIMAFLRLATHPGVFPQPLTPEAALQNIRAFLAASHVRVVSEEDGFLDLYSEITGAFPVRGNLVTDAHIATLLKQHGVDTIYTNDTDFLKFSFLKVRNPLNE